MDLVTLALAKAYTDKQAQILSDNTPTKTSELTNDSGFKTESEVFYAEYGTTTYEETLTAYNDEKEIILKIPGTDSTPEFYAMLVRVDGGGNNRAFTFVCEENGIAHYYSIDTNSKWNTWNVKYNETMNHLNTRVTNNETNIQKNNQNISKIATEYKHIVIEPNGKYQLREKGFYIFGGYDYDLNLCDASGNTIGKTKSLVIIVFCTEADANGNFMVYVMQNYKGSLSIPSMDGMPYSNFTKDYYVHNTNTSESAYVYYMRQNEV